MRVGVVFPQTELGGDPGAVRAYGERVEELGFSHILAYDHVVGADPAVHNGWDGPYDVHTTFHEPFVMFGYLAAVTQRVELVTGVIILPQRQTVLVAKQAAEVDLLSGGRLRLGIGVGWNAVEYEALGEEFSNRGKRSVEQISLLRRLWTEQTVTFDGDFHRVTGAGIAPLPTQQPIPVWIGAASAPGFAARRSPGRRMVPDDGARTRARRSTRRRRAGGARGGPRSRKHRDGGPGGLAWRQRRGDQASSRRGPRRVPLMSRSTRWAPGWRPSMTIWRRCPRSLYRCRWASTAAVVRDHWCSRRR